MVIFYIVSMKLPQWLKKWQDKKDNVKVKKYAQEETNPMANSMNMSMYFMTAMICIMCISWLMAMSLLVSIKCNSCMSIIDPTQSYEQKVGITYGIQHKFTGKTLDEALVAACNAKGCTKKNFIMKLQKKKVVF